MSDSGSRSPVPPPPQRYSRAANALARRFAPFFGSRPPSPQNKIDGTYPIKSKSLPGEPQTVTHRTGIPIAALDASPDRTHAVIGGKEILKTIRVSPDHSTEEFNLRDAIINNASTQQDGVMPHKDQLNVQDVKWSHSNFDRIIATAVANGRIIVYDLQRPDLQLCRFQGHNRQVHRLAFNPYLASWLLSGSQDGTIRMWDLRLPPNRGLSTCSSKNVYHGNSDAIRDVRWSPGDGVVFATASDSGAIQMWDTRKTNAPLMRIAAHDRPCYAVDWHPDGKHIVSGGTDRQVKVWDFSSSADRRQKPAFHFRTPQAVTNVRWRPPSWIGDSQSSGQWQSFQLLTSYDKEDPRIHLWDLRRTHVPFREFDRYDSQAADLLWHSKDLLWTVGEAGAFTQTDVRYAPTVVNRRPTCSVAWSPDGKFVAFSQKRPRRRPLDVDDAEFISVDEDIDGSNGENLLSQSPSDDVIDEATFASSFRYHQKKPTTIRPTKSLGSTPPGAVDIIPVLPLDQALGKNSIPFPSQMGAIGTIPGATSDESLFRFLARNYAPLMNECGSNGVYFDDLNSLIESLDHNAERADEVSLTTLAQTWRIVKFAILQELQRRSREQPARKGGVKGKPSKDFLTEKSKTVDEKVKSRLFKGVMETEGQTSLIPEAESTSNMTTPLARPLPDSPKDAMDSWTSSDSQIPSVSDDTDDFEQLPPSVLSSHNGWGMSVPETGPIASAPEPMGPIPHSIDVVPSRLLEANYDLDSDQRSAPRAIAGRADWRGRGRPAFAPDAPDDDYDQKMENKRAALNDYKHIPKSILTLDSPMGNTRPLTADRYMGGSAESFPMFSASTDSSNPEKSIVASYSSNGRFPEGRSSDTGQASQTGQAMSHASESPKLPVVESIVEPTLEKSKKALELANSIIKKEQAHLDRPSSPFILVAESTPLELLESLQPRSSEKPHLVNNTVYPTVAGFYDDLSQVNFPLTSDTADPKPWSIEAILKEAVRYYHSGSSVDIQTAAYLLQKLHVLFQDCEQIFPHAESQEVFQTYNEYLVRHSMDVEAAELRLSCVPTYPIVYDYAQIDTYINVFCHTCQRPYENPKRDNTRCYRCNTPQAPCAICMSIHPPQEWVEAQQTQSLSIIAENGNTDIDNISPLSSQLSFATERAPESELARLDDFTVRRPRGAALWTWCQGCGHGGHLACITTWLSDLSISEGGCATPGCSHDCGPGKRREANRQAQSSESRRRDTASRSSGVGLVKRDPWTRGESKAVEKARGMLGAAGATTVPSGSAGASAVSSISTTHSASGQVPSISSVSSSRKVRVVTPVEKDARALTLTGAGSKD